MQWDKTGSRAASMLHENPMPLVELEVCAYLMTKAAWQHAPCGGCVLQLGMSPDDAGCGDAPLVPGKPRKKRKRCKSLDRDKTNHRPVNCPIACQLIAMVAHN